jgi:hypothetical protein
LNTQGLTKEELAEMPSCNLAETVHNKWLQQSGKRGNDLYVATVDDYVRAFMQVVSYYQYLKGDRPGTGPGKEELKLRIAQRSAQKSGDPNHLKLAMAKMPGAEEFCTRQPHLEGEEVFGSTKRKLDLPPGSEYDSHRPDKVNFSHPRTGTRSTKARVDASTFNDKFEESTPKVQEELDVADASKEAPTPLAQGAIPHITAVQETACRESQWHIARLPKNSAKACFAQQAITKKKCIAKIVQNGKSTPAPTYTGLMDSYKKNKKERMQFFFCNDDIERCVKGTRRKWVVSRPEVPEIWPVMLGTNLTKAEILALEDAGFQLPQLQEMSPRRLFGDARLPLDMSSYPTPSDPDHYSTKRLGKLIRRTKKPSLKQTNNCASALTVKGEIHEVTMIPQPGYGCIITLNSGLHPRIQQYQITISDFPECSCHNFKEMLTKAKRQRGQWANCKHLYFIFNVICKLDAQSDLYIHAPSFSFNEVKCILEGGVLNHAIN